MRHLALLLVLATGCTCPSPPPEYVVLVKRTRADLTAAIERHPDEWSDEQLALIRDRFESMEWTERAKDN